MKAVKAIPHILWNIMTNRSSHLFAAGHTCFWALYLCIKQSTPNQCAYSLPGWHFALAGRFVSYLDPVLNVVDLPGLLLSMPMLDYIDLQAAPFYCMNSVSWFKAMVLFVGTLPQWLIIGYAFQQVMGTVRRRKLQEGSATSSDAT